MLAPIDDHFVNKLLLGMFVQAVKDASSVDKDPEKQAISQEARAWLCEFGAAWAAAAGLRVTGAMLAAWARDGYPKKAKESKGKQSPKIEKLPNMTEKD